ncbi:MAG: UDP-N-acetylglucosamine pyrophosphorylase [Phycisphaerales bacterium]|nr:UDP-N-acetylglucosamine pyrophosphorylase [Phycisphaerales bacterium]
MSAICKSSSNSPVAVILAAGKGTRMGSDLPKVMHPAHGKPLVEWVVDACRAADCTRIILVVGHGAALLRAHFAGQPNLEFVMQEPQLGTGHAVDQARPLLATLAPDQEVLVLCGDGPLIRASTIRTLLKAHRQSGAAATLATSVIANADTYGRIVRDGSGRFDRIIEQKDATTAQRSIREVNPSYYCFACGPLLSHLSRINNRNASGEYYLTDLFHLIPKDGLAVHVVDAVPPEEVLSVNTPAQLAEVALILKSRALQPLEATR